MNVWYNTSREWIMKSMKKSRSTTFKDRMVRFYIRHKPVDARDTIRLIVLAIAIPVFIYSSYQLVYKLYTYVSEERQMASVVKEKPDNGENPFEHLDNENVIEPTDGRPYQIIEGEDSYLNADGILKDYQTLWERNSDMIGWIDFPGFSTKPINYPILYSGDNSYYLKRDFDENASEAGSIFLDGSNTPFPKDPMTLDRNYVFYGHAMRNKTMFGNLTDYWTNEASWENTTIYIDFLNTRLEYEVFSTFVCDPYFNYRQTRFSSDQQYQEYLDMLVDKSNHDFGHTLTSADRIITLSTCYKTTRRTAIVAKLVRQIVYRTSSHGNIDIHVTPIALPTYMPFEVPSRAPTPTTAPSPGVTPGTTPGVTPVITGAPTGEPEPLALRNLLSDPGLESGTTQDWISEEGQILSVASDVFLSGQYSGFLENEPDDPSLPDLLNSSVQRDVTDLLNQQGSGRYTADAHLKAPDTTANAIIYLVLRLQSLPETSSEEPAPTPTELLVWYGLSPSALHPTDWTRIGQQDEFFRLTEETTNAGDIVTWDGYELVQAMLIIGLDSAESFYLTTSDFIKRDCLWNRILRRRSPIPIPRILYRIQPPERSPRNLL
jgi:sortase B